MFARLPIRKSSIRNYARRPDVGATITTLLILVLLLSLWGYASQWYQGRLLVERRSEVSVETSLRDSALSAAINRRLARLQGLYAFVQAELQAAENLPRTIDQSRFETFAAGLYAGSKSIRNLAIAPDGVVRYVYPLDGNEQVLGYAPLADPRPEVRTDVQRAITSRQPIVSGPLALLQGGLGLVARQAIYQDEELWGLVNIVLDLSPLLEEAQLDEESDDLAFALRDRHGQVLYGSADVFEQAPVISRIELPEGTWELASVPVAGWKASIQGPLQMFQAAGLVIAGLVTSLTYLSINRQSRLALAVRQRTQELQADIAQRKLVEAALREREEQYRSIFEASSDGLLINDLDGRLVDFNPAAAEMHGYTLEEFKSLHPQDIIHPGSWPLFIKYIEAVKADVEFRGRAVSIRKDGTPFPVEMLGTGFTLWGEPHALAVLRDITEQVQALQILEQRVEERTRELSTLLEISSSLASTLDLAPLTELVLDQLDKVIDYTSASVLILEEEAKELHTLAHRGPATLNFSPHQLETLWADKPQREPLLIPDVEADTPLARTFRQARPAVPARDEAPSHTWLGVPLIVEERQIGLLSIMHRQPGAYATGQIDLVLAIANQAAIAIENAGLYEQARRLAVLEERQRLARELHDSVSQALYGIGLGARTARAQLDRDPAAAAKPLEYVLSLADAGLAEMRALIFELRPDSLEQEGLISALSRQAAAVQARYGLEVHTEFCEEPELPFEVKESLYRIAQESLNNAVKHAQASRVEISFDNCEGAILLEVQDNGLGFDPQAPYPGHMGLQSMRERAARLDGTLEIESGPGQGTLVRLQLAERLSAQ